MKPINQLVYSIATICAIVSACTALPINVASIDHAGEMLLGLLALTCISVTILACTCCHRNKSGFEEFENENTIADQTNSSSRSEFPIFRAISPSTVSHTNNADNNLDNRILSNIVNQNQMNRTFNEFENSQNNNGPISVVDMENIQNNNAVDYIPNRNEINIPIEQSSHSANRNLVELNRDSSSFSTNETASTILEQSVPMPLNEFEYLASTSNNDTLNYQLNEFNDYRIDEEPLQQFGETATVSESLNNYIELEEESKERQSDHPKCIEDVVRHHDGLMVEPEVICRRVEADESTEPMTTIKLDTVEMESEPLDDDTISVEEALRALDFAISGGESIFSDDQDDSSSDEIESNIDDHEPIDDTKPIQTNNEPATSTFLPENDIELIKTVDAKDIFSENCAEMAAAATATQPNSDLINREHSREYVYDIAKELVDSVLDKCTEQIALLMHPVEDVSNDAKNESQLQTNQPIDAASACPSSEVEITDLDDSLEETFVVGKLEASTPCHKTLNDDGARLKNQFGMNLFQTLTEVNESALSMDGVEPLQKSQTFIGHATFEVQPIEPLAATFVKSDDKTFVAETPNELQETFNIDSNKIQQQPNEVPRINPIIRVDKEKDEVNSDDLTTITPMNTPIELNYVGETWDQFVSKSMNKKPVTAAAAATAAVVVVDDKSTAESQATAAEATGISKNAWFLHAPQTDDTFDVNDADYLNYDGTDEDSESVDENPELLSLTFDALRKQLADVLPQSSVRPSVEYSDDEDNASDTDSDGDNFEYRNRLDNPKSEVVINYKQQLSPILEESEDETCKTFVMNETKCLDSTSTGCIETSEAIMGVTKVLMASNDTLFNFEDTLGDREDMLSPRNLVSSGSNNTISSTTPQPDVCKTPTNEALLHAYPVEYRPNDTYTDNLVAELRPTSLQLSFENLTNNLNDLLSPEQQKTFSEEINTIEQLSSDLSATIDATNTLDDLKTCISVHLRDDANNSKLDNSENETNEQYQTKSIETNERASDAVQLPPCDAQYTNGSDTITPLNSIDPIDCAKENTSPNLDSAANNVTKSDAKVNLNQMNQIPADDDDDQSDSEQNQLNESTGQLSGEEDPWARPMADIRFSGPCTDDVVENMTGTFVTNDWDSDIDDSNSSEEFLYTKGTSQIGEYLRTTQNTMENDEQIDRPSKHIERTQNADDEQPDTQGIWNSHDDLIAVTTNDDGSTDDVLDESSISENENEWVPSSWDHLAKPVRSALKSPDKSSSKTGAKNRRSVVFKKQSYQSVYEYPKESASLSPTTAEPQGWATYLANSSPFSSAMNGSYPNEQTEDSSESPIDFNALDGFAISSSSRPFHLNQFSTECRTWPTDAEFSWSQIQSDKEHSELNGGDATTNHANGDLKEPKSPNSIHRPDSGVGESNEPLSESLSLGDLCHTKSSLRLPLNVFTATSLAIEKDIVQSTTPADDHESSKSISQNDYSENVIASDSMDSIVPTSCNSCTGSMDSINSFDGKSSQNHLNNSTNAEGLTEMRTVSNETDVHNDKKCDYRTTANRQSDSTDEDSGIENIVRVTKEV